MSDDGCAVLKCNAFTRCILNSSYCYAALNEANFGSHPLGQDAQDLISAGQQEANQGDGIFSSINTTSSVIVACIVLFGFILGGGMYILRKRSLRNETLSHFSPDQAPLDTGSEAFKNSMGLNTGLGTEKNFDRKISLGLGLNKAASTFNLNNPMRQPHQPNNLEKKMSLGMGLKRPGTLK